MQKVFSLSSKTALKVTTLSLLAVVFFMPDHASSQTLDSKERLRHCQFDSYSYFNGPKTHHQHGSAILEEGRRYYDPETEARFFDYFMKKEPTNPSQIYIDNDGYCYKTFYANQSNELLQFIDQSFRALYAHSTIVRSLFKNVMQCDESLLKTHIGDLPYLRTIINDCKVQPSIKSPLFRLVHSKELPIPSAKPHASSVSRNYALVLTNVPQADMVMSWTDKINATTYFVVNINNKDDLTFINLIKLLAHETSIYFDPKISFNEDLYKLDTVLLETSQPSKEIFVAANNPLISYLFSAIRAFQVEHRIIKELFGRERNTTYTILDDSLSFGDVYPKEYLWLFDPTSHRHKVEGFIRQTIHQQLSGYELALLVHHPTYLANLEKNAMESSLLRDQIYTLHRAVTQSQNWLENRPPIHHFLRPMTSEQTTIDSRIAATWLNESCNEDLHLISKNVLLTESPEDDGGFLWDYLLEPTLSVQNIDYSGGPRPRMTVVGGGRAAM